MIGVDEAAIPGAEGLDGGGFHASHLVPDGFGGEGAEDEAAEEGVVGALLEEDGLVPDHPLLAGGEGGLEELGLRGQDELGPLGAGNHHAGASQHVRLEYRPVPADRDGEKNETGESPN